MTVRTSSGGPLTITGAGAVAATPETQTPPLVLGRSARLLQVPAPPERPETPSLLLSNRKANVLGAMAVVLLLGGFGSWAALAPISGAVIAPGELEVEQNRQVVQHIDGGIVEEILVAEGDRVESGQILLRLEGTQLRSEQATMEAQHFETMARIARLSAERDGRDAIAFPDALVEAAEARPEVAELVAGQDALFAARLSTHRQRLEQLDQRQNQIRSLITGIDAQISAVEQQLEIARDELGSQERLVERGVSTSARLNSLRREVAERSGDLGDLVARRAEAMERILATSLEALGLVSRWQEEAIAQLRELTLVERDLREKLGVLADRMSRLDVRAPAAGLVHGLTVNTIGSVLGAADTVLWIVPQDQPLIASSRIETTDINRVQIGQPVSLQFPAFSFRSFPAVQGEVIHVSADAFLDERTRQSYYTIRIRIADEGLDDAQRQRLVPGMPVIAFAETDARSVFSYLISPLADYFRTSLREE